MNGLGDIFSPRRGMVIRTYGERIGIEKCGRIGRYEVIWNRTVTTPLGQKCYENLPILTKGEYKFLDLPTRQIHKLAREVDCESEIHPLYIEDNKGILWMISQDRILRDVHLKHKITHTDFKIPPLAPMSLNRKHYGDERAPVDSMLNYLATSLDEGMDKSTDESGMAVDKVTAKVKNKVKSWVETDVWVPIRKYVIVIVGSIIALALLTLIIKFLIRYRCPRNSNTSHVAERETPKVYILRKDRKKQARSGPPEQAEAML